MNEEKDNERKKARRKMMITVEVRGDGASSH